VSALALFGALIFINLGLATSASTAGRPGHLDGLISKHGI
jgi:hypothetical protein